jgi:hypothetical protein
VNDSTARSSCDPTASGWIGTAPAASCTESPAAPEWTSRSDRTPCDTFITAALDAGVPLRDVQEAASHADPRRPCATTEPASPSTDTRPASSPPTSLEQPDRSIDAERCACRGARSANPETRTRAVDLRDLECSTQCADQSVCDRRMPMSGREAGGISISRGLSALRRPDRHDTAGGTVFGLGHGVDTFPHGRMSSWTPIRDMVSSST